MSTLAHTTPAPTSSRTLVTSAISALVVLVGAAVVVLALTLPVSNRPTAHSLVQFRGSATPYEPTIQFRGDGAPPVTHSVQAPATASQMSSADASSPAYSRVLLAHGFIRLGR